MFDDAWGIIEMMKLLNRFKKVLIVEDDDALRHAIEKKLKGAGFRVLKAADGEYGLKTAMHEKPHLILLDLMLPKMDGLSLLRELRKDEWGNGVAVLVITVLNETDSRRAEAKELGVLEYIDKSRYQLDDILQKVQKAV